MHQLFLWISPFAAELVFWVWGRFQRQLSNARGIEPMKWSLKGCKREGKKWEITWKMESLWVFWPAELLIATSLTPTTLLFFSIPKFHINIIIYIYNCMCTHIKETASTKAVKELDKKIMMLWLLCKLIATLHRTLHLVYPFLPQGR